LKSLAAYARVAKHLNQSRLRTVLFLAGTGLDFSDETGCTDERHWEMLARSALLMVEDPVGL
jgi:hypothetical protein